ncbi:hypothetical protein D1BOALGB6SA_7992 [Olavius sp. associated proteobacterium Delta 1]|nr:hypothetical protein D1BOALGB6SA_7992 [Olavius sp. associated proteobacterium Delta 1]
MKKIMVFIYISLATYIPATHAESQSLLAAPSGMVAFFMQNDTCPNGWQEMEEAKGRMILGTITPALLGEKSDAPVLVEGQLPKHDHDYKVSGSWGHKDINAAHGGGNKHATKKGSHSGSGTTEKSTWELPLMQLKVCQSKANSNSQKESVVDAFPYSTVAFFNRQSCPVGWVPFKDMDGRFVVPLLKGGSPHYKKTAQWNKLDKINYAHQHKVSAKVDPSSQDFVAADDPISSSNRSFAKHEEKRVYGHTTNLNYPQYTKYPKKPKTLFPVIYMLSCYKISTSVSKGVIPRQTVAFYGSRYCPTGWSRTLTTAGRFLIGLPDNANPGAAWGGNPLKDKENRTHTHVNSSGSMHFSERKIAAGDGCCAHGFLKSGDHHFESGTWEASAAGGDIPYIQLSQCTKN